MLGREKHKGRQGGGGQGFLSLRDRAKATKKKKKELSPKTRRRMNKILYPCLFSSQRKDGGEKKKVKDEGIQEGEKHLFFAMSD